MNYPQGSEQLHKDLIAAFPNLAFGGEGTNDIIYRYNSFAQNWWYATDSSVFEGHPIANFLWNSQPTGTQTRYYGHLGQPSASDPAFIPFTEIMEREGFLPALGLYSASDLVLTQPDNARFLKWVQTWQANAFQPNWTGTWPGFIVAGGADSL